MNYMLTTTFIKQELLKHGTVWAFASDITESLVHVVKEMFELLTNRGGLCRQWTTQVMERSAAKNTVDALDGNQDLQLSPMEKKKLFEVWERQTINAEEILQDMFSGDDTG
jgi:hypothetical protein